jgi:6-phosphogluconate dehydrogenase
MQIGVIGVGRMGGIVARRLMRAGHAVIGYDAAPEALAAVPDLRAADSIQGLVATLALPRVIWLMLPPGEPTQEVLGALPAMLAAGDLVADGGNSFYGDSVRCAAEYASADLDFVDVGVSGGVWGLDSGYGVLAGGDAASIERVWPALEAIASPDGAAHVGPAGSGHFAKMVHNAVEYGVMQAYAEGYELLEAAELDVDVAATLAVWSRACSVRSFLLERMADAFERDRGFASVPGWVEDSGMGRWTVSDSVRLGVPAPVITAALQARFRSRQDESPAMRAVAATRKEVGGHAVKSHG